VNRRLDAEERALWARVAATVTPLAGKQAETPPPSPPPPSTAEPRRPVVPSRPSNAPAGLARPRPERVAAPPPDTLDGGWDRRLRRGTVLPDRTLDLHGHTLIGAHAALEAALARAIADDVRVLLVITGKPPRASEARRGLIRASIGDWLAGSGHRARIAAVRVAHPRHGGSGALYLIMRRKRDG
jgi:DNA-nicking Smr family endonuclease